MNLLILNLLFPELESFLDSNEVKSLILSKELSIEVKGITGKLSEAKDSLSKNFIYALIISFFLFFSIPISKLPISINSFNNCSIVFVRWIDRLKIS